MSWRKTLAYWALAGILFGYYQLFERHAPAVESGKTPMEVVLPFFSDEIRGLTLRSDDRELRSERNEKRWHVVRPENTRVPSDLFAALVESLTQHQKSEVIAPEPSERDVADFGLAPPVWTLEVESKDGKRTTVEFGDRNPPSTAIYARVTGSPKIFLIGLNVQYYGDLIFEAAYPRSSRASS